MKNEKEAQSQETLSSVGNSTKKTQNRNDLRTNSKAVFYFCNLH